MISSRSGNDRSRPTTPYGSGFFFEIAEGALTAGRRILPDVVERFRPASLVDVGCGTGGWAAAALELGVSDVLGIDGDYVDRGQLLLGGEQFRAADLQRPLTLSRRFDIVICTEVAEHLTAGAADTLVSSLTALGRIVIFSAAIPGQGGTNHINEQWPPYWTEKFKSKGYATIDWFRPRYWNDAAVPWWYRQNLFLAVDESLFADRPELAVAFEHEQREILPLVHPAKYLAVLAEHERLLGAPRSLLRRFLISLRTRLLTSR